jgi:hypothetical protein
MLAASVPICRYGTLTAVMGGCIKSRSGMSLYPVMEMSAL